MDSIIGEARAQYLADLQPSGNGDYGALTRLVERFVPVLEEFHVFTRPFRQQVPVYDAAYAKLVGTLVRIYKLEPDYEGLLVNVYEYSTDVWGPLYWRFFHLASLLLVDAMHSRGLEDTRDFGLLVRNIDAILPCHECAAHYREIRDTPEIQECIKRIAFGYVASGLQAFHNHVTLNVRKHNGRGGTEMLPFLHIDFAAEYGCVERTLRGIRSTRDYVRPGLDWQPELTRALALLLMLRLRTNFTSASDLLKELAYGVGTPVPSVDKTESVDGARRARLVSDLTEALVTQHLDKDICDKIGPQLEAALRLVYAKFPTESRLRVEALDDTSSTTADDNQKSAQRVLDKAQLLGLLPES